VAIVVRRRSAAGA